MYELDLTNGIPGTLAQLRESWANLTQDKKDLARILHRFNLGQTALPYPEMMEAKEQVTENMKECIELLDLLAKAIAIKELTGEE